MAPEPDKPGPEFGGSLGSSDSEWHGRRDNIRRSFLRANTAVGVVLIAVFGLALAAVLASVRATRQQQLAEQAHETARTELGQTYLSKAHAARVGASLDRRHVSLRDIANAARIQPSSELRNEAIAALALHDFVLESSWPLPEGVRAHAFDRALQQYAIGMDNGDIIVRRLTNNSVVQWLHQTNGGMAPKQGAVSGLEFSPQCGQLAARYARGGVAVWDVAQGNVIFRHAVDKFRQTLSRPRFTSDGRHLICMTSVPREGLAVFDLSTATNVAFFPEFRAWHHASPRPGDTTCAVNTDSNSVVVLDWRSGKVVTTLQFPAGVLRTAWSPDGRSLALGGNIVDVHVWDLPTGQKRVLTGHTADVRNLAFDPSGQWLISASWDGTSRIWETGSGRLVGSTDRGFAESFGEDGRFALSLYKGAVEVWALRPSRVHRVHTGPGPTEASTWALDLSPDGRWLASLVVDRGMAIWDLAQEKLHPAWFPLPGARMLSFHPHQPSIYLTGPRSVTLRSIASPTNLTAPLELGPAASLSLPKNFDPQWLTASPAARMLALGSVHDGHVFVLNPETPTNVVWLKGLSHASRLEARYPGASSTGGGTIALSRDGTSAVCGYCYPDGTKVWNARTGDYVTTLTSDYTLVEFSPDDRTLVAGSRNSYQLFRASDWQEIWRVPREGALFTAGPCAFSPEGGRLAVAKSPQNISIIDSGTGRELIELQAPRPAMIKAIRWSPDGRRLVLGTGENLIQIWELDALQNELATLGLSWSNRAPAAAQSTDVGSAGLAKVSPRSGIVGALVLGICGAGLVTSIALLAVRRHRRLIEDFARTEALVSQRERELQVERDVARLKSSFVSMVSHEFRTPLAVIQAASENLGRYFERLDGPQREQLLDDIRKSTHRMNGLIEEVLLLGKVDSGRMEFQPAPVDLPAICRRVIADVRSATHDRCPIELDAVQPMPGLQLDENLLLIILNNLLANAVKYSPPARLVHLSLRLEPGELVLEVRDQGIGIPAADVPQMFNAFRRGSNVGNLPGTGLGLAIVKRCLDLHHGTVSLTSVEGVGTHVHGAAAGAAFCAGAEIVFGGKHPLNEPPGAGRP